MKSSEKIYSNNKGKKIRMLKRTLSLKKIMGYAKNKTGRWTEEENNIFEKNYIKYLKNQITLLQLKKSVPTRTALQIHSHLFKKKYELDRKFCSISNPRTKEQIIQLSKFFEERKNKNSGKLTQLVYLKDEIRKKNFVIPLDCLLLLKSLLPMRDEIKFDFQLIHNFLLAQKSNLEIAEMVERHDKELNRKKKNFSNESSSLNPSYNRNIHKGSENSFNLQNQHSIKSEPVEKIFQKEIKGIIDSHISKPNISDMSTATYTPLEDKKRNEDYPEIRDFNASYFDNNNTNKNYFSFSSKKHSQQESDFKNVECRKKNILNFFLKNQKHRQTMDDSQSSNDSTEEGASFLLKDTPFYNFIQSVNENNKDAELPKIKQQRINFQNLNPQYEEEYEKNDSPSNLFNMLITSLGENSCKYPDISLFSNVDNQEEFQIWSESNSENLYLKLQENFQN